MKHWTSVSSPNRKDSYDSTPGRQTIQLNNGPKQTVLQGGHTEGPETYENILNMTSHKRVTN